MDLTRVPDIDIVACPDRCVVRDSDHHIVSSPAIDVVSCAYDHAAFGRHPYILTPSRRYDRRGNCDSETKYQSKQEASHRAAA